MKRLFDLVVAAMAATALSPLMGLIAILVRLESRGPAIFRQLRVGQHGNDFEILKFRSMSVSTSGPSVTVTGDSRITGVGRVLRASKLDELPQLVNVIRGDMSLVGPRPEVPEYVAMWPADARDEVLSVRPGITDPASVAYRRESEELAAAPDPADHYVQVIMPRKLELYRAYVRNRSLLGDAIIILQTLRTVARD